MKPPHILLLNKNVVELRLHLTHILDKKSTSAFDRDIKQNVAQLYTLGIDHLTFASGLTAAQWRHVVSRAYYSAYSLSKAVRLAVRGHYSQESKDHEKVGDLPDDFPDRNTYANRLRLLRDDRNLCDYDHTASIADLGVTPTDALALVGSLAADAKAYLKSRKYKV